MKISWLFPMNLWVLRKRINDGMPIRLYGFVYTFFSGLPVIDRMWQQLQDLRVTRLARNIGIEMWNHSN